ncbi:PASTA domain-containing protein [Geofilum rhodophaeum]|uniref:PASTA domain-containing protein n=1 Tax=Geofilum rhodophaeum TaxID=1965019 RepID=UPI0011BAAE49|nr:PASTA domain-containing protein [Geofilum rhodophaeum]
MPQWKNIFKNSVWKHLGIVVGASILFLIAVFLFLKIYTQHGQGKPVPDFTGLTEKQLQHLIRSNDLLYTIIDSVHTDFAPRGVVLEQTPKAGEKVKKNRRIFFTINSWTDEQIIVPNLRDNSLRNAQVMLESYGLKLGNLIYIPSEFTNMVLGQHFEGKPVEPGTLVRKGSSIDLLVGRGLSNETTAVPQLTGMTLDAARKAAQNVYLNLGATIYADTIATAMDSLKAFVWRQSPPASEGFVLNLGASIDVWLTTDTEFHPDTLKKREAEQALLEQENPEAAEETESAFEEELF